MNQKGKTMSTYPAYDYFSYKHLPEHLQEISKPFAELASKIIVNNPEWHPQADIAMQKLLEAKDAAVRAAIS